MECGLQGALAGSSPCARGWLSCVSIASPPAPHPPGFRDGWTVFLGRAGQRVLSLGREGLGTHEDWTGWGGGGISVWEGGRGGTLSLVLS